MRNISITLAISLDVDAIFSFNILRMKTHVRFGHRDIVFISHEQKFFIVNSVRVKFDFPTLH